MVNRTECRGRGELGTLFAHLPHTAGPSPAGTQRMTRRALPILLAALTLAACAERPAEPDIVRPAGLRVAERDADAEAARAILLRASPAIAAGALRRLEAEAYTVDVRFRELDSDGALVRRWHRELERAPDSTRDADETLLGEVLAGHGGPLAMLKYVDPIDILLPAHPPYLRSDVRGYVVRLLPDTEIDGRRVRGAEALRRQSGEPIRLVRSWIDAESSEPVAIELVRESSSMLLTEEVRVRILLEGPGGRGLARAAHIDATVALLGESPRRFIVDLAVGQGTMEKSERPEP